VVESSIGSNVRYAGVHEFGFSGVVTVKEFTRKSPQGDKFLVGGGVASRKFATRVGLTGRKLKAAQVASGVSRVRAHTRKMNVSARAYLRKSVAERLVNYSAEMEKRTVAAMEGATQ
jgi:phage gpG-like protein